MKGTRKGIIALITYDTGRVGVVRCPITLMETSQGGFRRIALGIVGALILFALLFVVNSITRPKTAFEWEQAHAEGMNPRWVLVEITTADNRREYRQSDPIFVTAHFSSTRRYTYKIEVMEGWSTSAVDVLHISNGQQVIGTGNGIVCCASHLIGLDDQPYSPKPRTPLRLAPGEYEIYLTSHRIFSWEAGPESYGPRSFQVASNMLKIRVVPDADKMPVDLK